MSVSPNGAIIYGGQAGSLTTSEGTWTFGAKASDGVDWYIQLNGSQNGWGFQMQIANGNLYTVNKVNGHWYLRKNAAWVDIGSVSPDGLVIYGGQRGILATSEGTWTFGAQASDGVDWYIQLNGSQVGWGSQMQITNGNLYTLNKAKGHWYLRQNGSWVDFGTTAPVEGAPPPPSSPTITVNGSNPATVTTGGNMTVAVANGPGSPTDWVAIYSASVPDNTPNGWVGHDDLYLNGSETTAPATGLKSATLTFPVPSTPGAYQARFYANDSYTVIARAGITVNASAPPPQSPTPTAITLSPASATIADNAPAGTLIATANVTMSDGSQFQGVLTTSDTNFFVISGLNIVTARSYTSADDGTHSTIITASQGGQSFSIKFSV